jgi:hypothetical protein
MARSSSEPAGNTNLAREGSRYEVGEGVPALAAGQVVVCEYADDKDVLVTYYEPVTQVVDGELKQVEAPRTVRLTPTQFAKGLTKTTKKAGNE